MTTERQRPEGNLELEVRAIAAERLTFFGDAVIAIALTLLALDLPKPVGDTNGELLRSALQLRDEYLAFIISFLVIAAHWRGHHRVFRYVTTLGGRLTGLTLAWLFMQVITPFTTRVLTGDGAFEARFDFYAIVQFAASVLFILMIREIRTNKLYRGDSPPDIFVHPYLRTGVIAGAFLVSIPVSFFTHWAYVCWFVPPVTLGWTRKLRGLRDPHAD
jgi:uncharacterized membrane protein